MERKAREHQANIEMLDDMYRASKKDYAENLSGRPYKETCFKHPDSPIQFIIKPLKKGVCHECLFPYYKQGMPILSVEDTVKDIRRLL